MKEPRETSVWMSGARFADQHTAACGSTKVGCCEQSSTRGSPWQASAAMP